MAFKYARAADPAPSFPEIIKFMHMSNIPFTVSSTNGGKHVTNSWHYSSNAVDSYSSAGDMQRLAGWLINYAPYIGELIHSGGKGFFVKNGEVVPGSRYGAKLISEHYNHVHLGMTLSGVKAAEGQQGNSGTISTEQAGTASHLKLTSGCLPTAASVLILISSISGLMYEVWR